MFGSYNHFFVYERAIPPQVCQRIIKDGLARNQMAATTTDNNKDARQSTIAWFDVGNIASNYIDTIVRQYVHGANTDAGWNFNLVKIESLQFTIYKPGQYYDWHPDILFEPRSEPKWANLSRKLSMTLALNGDDEYEGGDFEIEVFEGSPDYAANRLRTIPALRKQGSILIFPSFLWHRVKPVTQGTRYSLVSWYLGYPFT
jgi:PKHD-type hydroxylase